MNEDEGRKLLAVEVQADRRRLYRTVEKARLAGNLSRGAWDNVEAGRSAKPNTLADVERALHWPAGRAQRIIDGLAEPTASADGEHDLRRHVLEADVPAHVKSAMIALLDSVDPEPPAPSTSSARGA